MSEHIYASALITQMNAESNKVPRITTNTIEGKYLKKIDIDNLKKLNINEKSDEFLFVWLENDKFEPIINIGTTAIVCITNLYLVKFEKGSVTLISRSAIKKIQHEKNGIFRWDQLKIQLVNGKEESIGIYNQDTCEYFCNYLSSTIN